MLTLTDIYYTDVSKHNKTCSIFSDYSWKKSSVATSLNVFKGGIRKMVYKMRSIYEKENRKTRKFMKHSKDPVSADYKRLELRYDTGVT